jgi:hypothetical protein
MNPNNEPFDPFKKIDEKSFDEMEMWIWVDFFCERYGWTVDQVLNMRITTFYKLHEAIIERGELEKKRIKSKGK